MVFTIKGSRRDGRVVEGGGLENRCPERDRGFESYSLRQVILPCRMGGIFIKTKGCFLKQDSGEMAELAEGARLLSELWV